MGATTSTPRSAIAYDVSWHHMWHFVFSRAFLYSNSMINENMAVFIVVNIVLGKEIIEDNIFKCISGTHVRTVYTQAVLMNLWVNNAKLCDRLVRFSHNYPT